MSNEPNIAYVSSIAWLPLAEPWRITATVAAGGFWGGVTSSMAGGDFWEGVCNGLICAGLNHAMHLITDKDPQIYAQKHRLTRKYNVKKRGFTSLTTVSTNRNGRQMDVPVVDNGVFEMDYYITRYEINGERKIEVGAVSATTSSDGTIIPCVKADLYVDGKMVSSSPLIDNEGLSIVSEGHQNVGTVRFDVPESGSIIEVRVQGGWNVSRFIGNNAVMNSNNFGRVGFDETHQVYF